VVKAQAAVPAPVTGTPAFFVNGRMLIGAQPFEVQDIIDDELAQR
jgi:protein-disulfide isomerase